MRASFLVSSLIMMVGSVNAAQVSSSTAVAVGFHVCIPGATACSVIGPQLGAVYGGTPGGASATVTASHAGVGEGSSFVSLTGVDGAPIVHAMASSDTGARVNTTAFALQSYTYTGTVPTTRTFGGTLTFSQIITGDYPGPNGNGIYAAIDVFELSTGAVDVGSSTASNFSALASAESMPGYVDLANDSYTSALTMSGVGTLSAPVVLLPGETVWIEAIVQTPAPNGAVIDASHTFVTGWDDASNLVAASSVPEPGIPVMWGVGMGLAMLACARAHRSSPG